MKWYGKYGRKAIWIVKWYRNYGRKLWNDIENMEVSRIVIRYGQYGRK